MQPFQIIINGKQHQLLQPLPDKINSLSIISHPMVSIQVQRHEALLIKQWLNDIVDRLTCTHISYNDNLIQKTDIKKFTL